MKNTRFMKRFGDTKTHLTLTPAAQKFYDETDPIDIYEERIEPEDEDGDVEYRYSIRRAFFGDFDNLTGNEVNDLLTAGDEPLFFPDEEYVDRIFGSLDPYCMTEEEVRRLSAEWGCDLFEQVHEASAEELDEYGIAEDHDA